MSTKTIPYPSANAVELAALDADTLAGLFQASTVDHHLQGLAPMLRDEICRRWMAEQPAPQFAPSLVIALRPCAPAHSGTHTAYTGA